MKRRMSSGFAGRTRFALLFLCGWSLLSSSRVVVVEAVLPTLALDLRVGEGEVVSTMLLSHALFGPYPSQLSSSSSPPPPLTLTYPPDEDNFLLCRNLTATEVQETQLPPHSLLLVPRGECTFEAKVRRAQQLGAAAVIVYGTLASRYSVNETATSTDDDKQQPSSIIYPGNKYDYDCERGQAWIAYNDDGQLDVEDPGSNEARLSSFSYNRDAPNLCLQNSDDHLQNCPSQACLLTGNYSTAAADSNGESLAQACCAWDLKIWLYPDNTQAAADDEPESKITIPAAYMTMQQFSDLVALQAEYDSLPVVNGQGVAVTAVLYARWRPAYNLSAIIIWLLGCTVCAVAAYTSASDYHQKTAKVLERRRQREQEQQSNNGNRSRPPSQQQQPHRHNPAEEILELTAAHAAGFVVMASTSLLVLFYFKIYGIVKVFYAIGCSTAVTQVVISPLYHWTAKTVTGGRPPREVVVTTNEEFGDITLTDLLTHAIGFGLGLAWLVLAFTVRDAENIVFFWVMQDLFGACMCIVFLKVIRLNSIRVAAILLIIAFFYDIFFVFVTPYLFQGRSVMITVATSGGPPKADALWCEKYPDDRDCQGGNPLPMLLAIPKLLDFAGGSSLLGLGDIVLPGLLLSFAARLDAAKQLLGVMGGGRGSGSQSYHNCPEQQICCCSFSACCAGILCRGGYLAPLIVAYAVGLAMANTGTSCLCRFLIYAKLA